MFHCIATVKENEPATKREHRIPQCCHSYSNLRAPEVTHTQKHTHTAVSAERKRLGGLREEHYNLLNEGKKENKNQVRVWKGLENRLLSVCSNKAKLHNKTALRTYSLWLFRINMHMKPFVCLCVCVCSGEPWHWRLTCYNKIEQKPAERSVQRCWGLCGSAYTWYTHSGLGTWPPMRCTCANTTWFPVAPHGLLLRCSLW